MPAAQKVTLRNGAECSLFSISHSQASVHASATANAVQENCATMPGLEPGEMARDVGRKSGDHREPAEPRDRSEDCRAHHAEPGERVRGAAAQAGHARAGQKRERHEQRQARRLRADPRETAAPRSWRRPPRSSMRVPGSKLRRRASHRVQAASGHAGQVAQTRISPQNPSAAARGTANCASFACHHSGKIPSRSCWASASQPPPSRRNTSTACVSAGGYSRLRQAEERKGAANATTRGATTAGTPLRRARRRRGPAREAIRRGRVCCARSRCHTRREPVRRAC